MEYLANTLKGKRSEYEYSAILAEKDRIIQIYEGEIEEKDESLKSLSDMNKKQLFKNREFENQISSLQAQVEFLKSHDCSLSLSTQGIVQSMRLAYTI